MKTFIYKRFIDIIELICAASNAIKVPFQGNTEKGNLQGSLYFQSYVKRNRVVMITFVMGERNDCT